MLKEEKEKMLFLAENPEQTDTLFQLEDHFILNGQISIIGLENLANTSRFESLFQCNLDLIDCAMMAIGDYGQVERNKWRYQYGSTTRSAWEALFHKSANTGFDNTKRILNSLLVTNTEFSNDIPKKIADDYVKECEDNRLYTFRYYYIKYREYRPGAYGKMWNITDNPKSYMRLVMQTELHISLNTYMPFLKIASESHISRDDYGQRLVFDNEHIICTNNAFVRRKNGDNSIIDTIIIAQNDAGIDTEDRAIVLKNYIKENF